MFPIQLPSGSVIDVDEMIAMTCKHKDGFFSVLFKNGRTVTLSNDGHAELVEAWKNKAAKIAKQVALHSFRPRNTKLQSRDGGMAGLSPGAQRYLDEVKGTT